MPAYLNGKKVDVIFTDNANIEKIEQRLVEATRELTQQAQESAEQAQAYAESMSANKFFNTFSNALKGKDSGETISLYDISPIEHEMDVRVSAKKNGNLLKSPFEIGGELESGKTYIFQFEVKNEVDLGEDVAYALLYDLKSDPDISPYMIQPFIVDGVVQLSKHTFTVTDDVINVRIVSMGMTEEVFVYAVLAEDTIAEPDMPYETDFSKIKLYRVAEESSTVKGLDATKAYEYAKVNYAGISDTWTAIPAGAEYTFENPGLYAIRVAKTATEDASAPFLFHNMGSPEDFSTIFNTEKKNYSYGTNVDVIKWASFSDRLNPQFSVGKWTGWKVDELQRWDAGFAMAIGSANYGVPYDELGEKILNGDMSQDDAKAFIKSIVFKYAYEDSEIVPFACLEKFSVKTGNRQGHIYIDEDAGYKVYTKFVVYIANERGEIETRTITRDACYDWEGVTSQTEHTISASDFDDTSGYIVAIDVYPFGEISDDAVVQVEGENSTNYIMYLQDYQIKYFYAVNADGTVDGVTSLYPKTTLYTDTNGVTIEAEYNRDINKAYQKLEDRVNENQNITNNTNKFSNALKGKTNGEHIALTDVSPIEHEMGVRVSRKNLIKYPYSEYIESGETTIVKQGVTIIDNGDGSLTLNGFSNPYDLYYYLNKASCEFLEHGKKYSYAVFPKTTTGITLELYFSDGANGASQIYSGQEWRSSYIFHYIRIKVSKNITFENCRIYPQLEEVKDNSYYPKSYMPYVNDLSEIKLYQEAEAKGTIKGLDAKKPYEYAKVNYAGISDTWTAIPAGTEYTFENPGLYAIRVAKTATEDASAPFLFHVFGTIENRSTIINTETKSYPNGTLYDKSLKELDVPKWTSYSDRLNPKFAIGRWTGWRVDDLQTYSADWRLVIGSANYGVPYRELGEKIWSGTMSQAEAKEFIKSIVFKYAYEDSEIIPFAYLEKFSVRTGNRQGHILIDQDAGYKVYTKFVAYIANESGEIETRTITRRACYDYPGFSSTTEHTISASDFDDTSGYIVAIDVYPFGEISDNAKVQVVGRDSTNYYMYLQDYQINCHPSNVYEVDSNGTVKGTVNSLYPVTRFYTDTNGVTIEAEYNRDVNKVVAEQQAQIDELKAMILKLT